MIFKFFTGKWSSYFSGVILAFLFVFMLYVLNSPVGMSNAYLMLSEYCQESFHNRAITEPPFLDWQTGFLGGILIGACFASIVSGKWRLRMLPESDGKNFFASAGITVLLGITGGFLVMLGLQLAGDSFIGQWASAIQLSTGAWIYFISISVWGILFTLILSAKLNTTETKSEKTEKKNDKK